MKKFGIEILFLLLVGLTVLPCTSYAQRVYATVNPTTLDESLRFDTNNAPVGGSVNESGPQSTSGTRDLNISPNVVFAPDGTKAFLSYSGSDKVMVFDPANGAILRMIEVGPNPGLITMTPDGHSIVVACLRLGDNTPKVDDPGLKVATIGIIDVATLGVRRIELNSVLLSVANNIVISADSKTGIIASLGTDELVRFNLPEGVEVSPRVEFKPGHRPASISLSPDGRTLAVVLIGSAALDRTEAPDAVALVDLASFQVKKTISPPTNEDLDEDGTIDYLMHDFTAATNFAFSADGKFGIIADCEYSNLSTMANSDRAWIYDFENQAFLSQPVTVGTNATFSCATPSSEFLVMGAYDLTFIEPVEVRAAIADDDDIPTTTISPGYADFRPGSRPAFSPDGQSLYLAAPLYDKLLLIDFKTGEIRQADVGGEITRTSVDVDDGDDDYELKTLTLTSAPLELTLSPAGDIVAVVNFNANTVDLVKQSWRSYLPVTLFSDELFTGLAVSNGSDTLSNTLLTGYYSSGARFSDTESTEDVVEFTNPADLTLPSRAQVALTLEEWLKASQEAADTEAGEQDNDGNETTTSKALYGWMELNSAEPGTRALFLSGDADLKRLDGSVAADTTRQRLVFPAVRVADGWNTELFILNPNVNTQTVLVELLNERGQVVEVATQSVAGTMSLRSLVRQPTEDEDSDTYLFSRSVFEKCQSDSDGDEDESEDDDESGSDGALHCGFSSGYLIARIQPQAQDNDDDEDELVVEGGMVAFARYFDPERMEMLAGVSAPYEEREGEASQGGQTAASHEFYVPQVVAFGGTDTVLSLVNPTFVTLHVLLELRQPGMSEPIGTKSISLEPAYLFRGRLADIFSLPGPGLFNGWLLVRADGIGLAGSAELLLANGKSASVVPLQSFSSTQLFFSHFVRAGDLSSGLALVNPSSEPASLTVRVYSQAGQLVGQADHVPLLAGQQVSQLITEWMPEIPEQAGGHIEVSSDRPVAGLVLFFRNDLEFLSAVLPQ